MRSWVLYPLNRVQQRKQRSLWIGRQMLYEDQHTYEQRRHPMRTRECFVCLTNLQTFSRSQVALSWVSFTLKWENSCMQLNNGSRVELIPVSRCEEWRYCFAFERERERGNSCMKLGQKYYERTVKCFQTNFLAIFVLWCSMRFSAWPTFLSEPFSVWIFLLKDWIYR